MNRHDDERYAGTVGVNHPDHYQTSGMEVIEVMKQTSTLSEYLGFLRNSALKYLFRWDKKGSPEQDLKKLIWYAEEMLAIAPYIAERSAEWPPQLESEYIRHEEVTE